MLGERRIAHGARTGLVVAVAAGVALGCSYTGFPMDASRWPVGFLETDRLWLILTLHGIAALSMMVLMTDASIGATVVAADIARGCSYTGDLLVVLLRLAVPPEADLSCQWPLPIRGTQSEVAVVCLDLCPCGGSPTTSLSSRMHGWTVAGSKMGSVAPIRSRMPSVFLCLVTSHDLICTHGREVAA